MRALSGRPDPPVSLCSEYYHFRQAWIPLRWMPPEAVLEDEFSTKSDVWSFGVLMWEVFTHGEMPHAKLADDEVLAGTWGTAHTEGRQGWAEEVAEWGGYSGLLPSLPLLRRLLEQRVLASI